ncbi:MAG: hypothetical protein ACE15E_19195 [Acidobacteriota bacterium]
MPRRIASLVWFVMFAAPVVFADSSNAQWRVFRYTMAGRLRLLLFWVGREGVGGGTIALRQDKGPDGQIIDSVEVLFGSNPQRVPGRINRWGYGRESAQWKNAASPAEGGTLLASTFEGFMRHSDEESLGEVRSRASRDEADETFWYDAIQSRVTPELASATVHIFAEKKDFDYTQPAPVECGYRRRLRAGPPDRSRQLKRTEFAYAAPYGFLTAVKAMVADVSGRIRQKSPKWSEYRPAITYIYNAKPYRLQLTDLELHREFVAPGWKLSDVIEAEFEITNLKTREEHSFSLWFPTTGPLQNIPVKIVDKPRWWLRVELTLEAGAGRDATELSSGVMPECSN